MDSNPMNWFGLIGQTKPVKSDLFNLLTGVYGTNRKGRIDLKKREKKQSLIERKL